MGLIVGIPNERPVAGRAERRVALTPRAVHELVAEDARVLVERGAGSAAGFPDEEYEQAGAQITYERGQVIAQSDLIVSVYRLNGDDLEMARPEQRALSFLRLASASTERRAAYAKSGIQLIAAERLVDPTGTRTVLAQMSGLVGRMAPGIAARLLLSDRDGRHGVFLGSMPGIAPSEVVVVGAGILGLAAAQAFAGLGASVHLLDQDLSKLRAAADCVGSGVTTLLSTQALIEQTARFANVWVGAIGTERGVSPVLSADTVPQMRKGSVILDFAIDQGGAAETSRPISGPDQIYERDGVVHFTMPNVPSLVARTASRLYSQALLPFVRHLVAHEGEVDHPGIVPALVGTEELS